MSTSYTALIIIDNPSYGNTSGIAFYDVEIYLENLVETDVCGGGGETCMIQFNTHTHKNTHKYSNKINTVVSDHD